MKKPLDRIAEAYNGEFGDVFREKVKNRVHWICENALGERILDIGCSQGLISIFLGRECKQVLGIDVHEESIKYANELLKNESDLTRQHVKFNVCNFLNKDFSDEKYDCIVMGEVLEHITDPKRFVDKAGSLLNDGGRLLITVPFGINDYFDHKKVYYLAGLLEILKNYKVEKVSFLGKWIGLVASSAEGPVNNTDEVSFSLLQQLENNFYLVEREHINNIKDYTRQIKYLDETKNENITIKNSFENKCKEIDILKKYVETKDNTVIELTNSMGNLNEKCSLVSKLLKEKEEALVKVENDKSIAINNFEILSKELENLRKGEQFYRSTIENLRCDFTKLTEALVQKQELLAKTEIESHTAKDNLLIKYEEIGELEKTRESQAREIIEKDRIINELRDKNFALIQKLEEKEKTLKDVQSDIVALKANLDGMIKDTETKNKSLTQYKKQLIAVQSKNIGLREEKVIIQKTLYESYQKEIKHLYSYEALLKKYNTMLKSSDKIKARYDAISNSKLGGLTLKFWSLKKKLKERM